MVEKKKKSSRGAQAVSGTRTRLEEEIKQKIGQYLRKSLVDQRLSFVSITKVELNCDNSDAKVYWDTFDDHTRGDAKAAIEGIAHKVRHHLSQNMTIRQVPHLKFIYDSQYVSEKEITDLLESERKRLEGEGGDAL